MLGAIIGDIVGSTREHYNVKTEDFELIPPGSRFTDDTVMTLAVAEWLMSDAAHTETGLIACMQRLGRKFPHAGYGGMFSRWLFDPHPKPYNSFGNGSAMRVSPVGLYASSLDEALELARITASVSHNHPEGIKGAQAIAACVYLQRQDPGKSREEIKRYVEEHFGYNLDIKLENLRPGYRFDVTCQGSVPIAIMSFLQRENAEKVLRLAISMGGDSDTIGCMAASIAMANPYYNFKHKEEVEAQCRALLPPDLLDINDRFEVFVNRPIPQSYHVFRKLYAGEYPGDKQAEKADSKLQHMHHFGVRHFIDLTEEGELRPYHHLLPPDTTYHRFPIQDVHAPQSVEAVDELLDKIDELTGQPGYTYLHCWGGVGRTGTIIACYLARLMDNPTVEKALREMREKFSQMPKAAYRQAPETPQQIDFIRKYVDHLLLPQRLLHERVRDRIRGSLMAGAAGDALGYPVEFMRRHNILYRYGYKGITTFALSPEGKALVSDDTQMTLFTANGMLMGVTRGAMRGIDGNPEAYVDGAYIDWYFTQTGRKNDNPNDFHFTWLRDLPELAHRRAPGTTCLSACECLLKRKDVQNNSKGCGGIMRVAPMALLMAGYESRGRHFYDVPHMDWAGAEVARITHKHPQGFLPAALLTHLIYRLALTEEAEIKANMADMAKESLSALDTIYKNEYGADKHVLYGLTLKAIELAQGSGSDAENIRQLGEGWTAEETWAIALYCAVRHIDSLEEALIAAVNHDGDSDSTGAVCGNIMGAVYGYEAIKRQNPFCPPGRKLEQTLELSEIILALADDLATGCIINEYSPLDTPEEQQWFKRYCEMKPEGIHTAD